MCGIVGAVAQRDVAAILVDGLHRLEYRGYDSAGVAVLGADKQMNILRRVGKVKALDDALEAKPLLGGTGIAHTRWATHGEPSETNAHPHRSGKIAVVHNGIIENRSDRPFSGMGIPHIKFIIRSSAKNCETTSRCIRYRSIK